jgi:hypothetical protein
VGKSFPARTAPGCGLILACLIQLLSRSSVGTGKRLGAHCLYHAKNYLGEFYRKMKWRLGAPEAITATAHKLARIVYHLLSTKEPYSEGVLARCDQQAHIRTEMRLRRQAANLGFQLARVPETNS